MTVVPAPCPCVSCPYRRDVPSGIWDESEYKKLPGYDLPTSEQLEAGAMGAFYCHQQDGRLCAGWVAVHDMNETLGFRLAASIGLWDPDVVEAILNYQTDVPLFATGAEAAEHGLHDLADPNVAARRLIEKIERSPRFSERPAERQTSSQAAGRGEAGRSDDRREEKK